MNTKQIAFVIVAACLAGFVWQYEKNILLRREVDSVRKQDREITLLRKEQFQLIQERAEADQERSKLRSEIAALQARPADAGPKPSAPTEQAMTTPAFSLATGLKPLESLGNVGRTTPQAAWETRAWAHRVGDIAMIAETMVLPPSARQKAEELFARMSPEARAQYETPDQLLATVFAGLTGPQAAGVQILSEQTGARIEGMPPEARDDPQYKTLRVQTQDAKGAVRENEILFQQTPDGWRQVIFANTVAKAGGVLGKYDLPKGKKN